MQDDANAGFGNSIAIPRNRPAWQSQSVETRRSSHDSGASTSTRRPIEFVGVSKAGYRGNGGPVVRSSSCIGWRKLSPSPTIGMKPKLRTRRDNDGRAVLTRTRLRGAHRGVCGTRQYSHRLSQCPQGPLDSSPAGSRCCSRILYAREPHSRTFVMVRPSRGLSR